MLPEAAIQEKILVIQWPWRPAKIDIPAAMWRGVAPSVVFSRMYLGPSLLMSHCKIHVMSCDVMWCHVI